MKTHSLEELVKRATAQDEQAFEELFRTYYASVYKAAMKICKNDADAQDATQLTFLQVRKSIHTLEKPSYFPLWINRICLNKCKNLFRSNKLDTFDEEYYKYSHQSIDTYRERNSVKQMHFTSDQEVLLQLIASLKPNDQQILKMAYFQQMSQEEIATQLNLPEGTVKSRLFKARNRLREKVEAYEAYEQIPLNFQMESLPIMFAMACYQRQLTLTAQLPVLGFGRKLIQNATSTLSGSTGSILALCSVGILCVGVGGAYNEMNQSKLPMHQAFSEGAKTEAIFPSIHIDSYVIDNEQDAYFLLRGYAYDAEALQALSEDVLISLQPLYEALRDHHGVFYDTLQTSGWSEGYETRMNLHNQLEI